MGINTLVTLLAILASSGRAEVPPEVPTTRTYQLFSPFIFDDGFNENGEIVFGSEGPACLEYGKVQEFRQEFALQEGVAPNAGVPQFVSFLRTNAGLNFISSHGKMEELLVEGWSGGAENEPLITQALQDYQAAGIILPGEARITNTAYSEQNSPLRYWAIAINKNFIQRILSSDLPSFATQSILFNNSCLSSSLADVFTAAGTRGYIGYNDCPLPTVTLADTRNIFNPMAGIQPVGTTYRNIPLATAIQNAQELGPQPFLSFSPQSPSANSIRLYNAPRVVFARVGEDLGDGTFSKNLYAFEFGRDYPFNPNGTSNYPADGITLSGKATAGLRPLLINLRFSEPMDKNSITVKMRFQNGSTQDVSGGTLSSLFTDDTWVGQAVLPAGTQEGSVVVAVSGRRKACNPDQDTANQWLDTSGSGFSPAGATDTSVQFKVDRTPPMLTIRENNASGTIIVDEGSTGISNLFIQAEDPGAGAASGISAITVFGLDVEFDQVRTFDGSAVAESLFTGVPDGYYWVIVEDVAGNQSLKEIRVARQLPAVSLSAGRINISGFRGYSTLTLSTLSRDVSLQVSDSIGLSALTVTGTGGYLFQRTFPASTFSFQSVAPDLTSLAPGEYTVVAANIEGHSTTINFRVANLEVEFLPEASESIYNGLSGSFSGKLKFRVSGTAPIREVRRIDPTSGQTIQTLTAPGSEFEFSGIQTNYQQAVPVQVVAIDDEGNSAAMTVNLEFTSVPPHYATSGEINFINPSVPYVTEGAFAGTYLLNPRVELGRNKTDGLTAGYASGSHISTPIDLLQLTKPLLPGAVMLSGSVLDPTNGTVGFRTVGSHGWVFGDQYASGPLLGSTNGLSSGVQEVGEVEFHLRTGQSSGSLGASTLIEKHLINSFMTLDIDSDSMFTGANAAIRLDRFFGYETRVLKVAPTKIFVGDCLVMNPEQTVCEQGKDYIPTVNSVGGEIFGQTFSTSASAPLLAATVPQGPNGYINLGAGVEVDQLNAIAAGELSLAVSGGLSPPGAFSGYEVHGVYDITPADPSFIDGSFRIKISYANAGLTPAQQSSIKVIRSHPNGQSEVLAAQAQIGEVSFNTTSFGQFSLLIPAFQNPISTIEGEATFLSNSVVTAAPESPGSLTGVLDSFRSQGKALASNITRLGPTGTTFSPPGVVTIVYSPTELSQLGLSESGVAIYQFTETGAMERLRNQVVDFGNRTVSARVGQFTSLFAIFGDTTPVGPPPSPDTTPPNTTLQFEGPMNPGAGGIFEISTFTRINLQALDPAVPNSVTSGVTQTLFSTAAVFSTATASAYSEPFTLAAGTYSLTFLSVDGAGNAEAPQTARIDILPEGSSSPDLTPPVTTLGFSGAFASTSGAAGIINEQSSVTFTAVDAGIGQVQTFYAVDPSSAVLAGGLSAATTQMFVVYGGGFSLIPGRRIIAYGSVDGAGNYEVLKSTAVEVEDTSSGPADTTPPVTTLSFNGFATSTAGAAAFIYDTSSVEFFPVEHGSGLAGIYYLVDPSSAVLAAGLNAGTTGDFQVYSGTFSLALGRRVLAYGAVDIAGNYEVLQSTAIEVGPEPSQGGGFALEPIPVTRRIEP